MKIQFHVGDRVVGNGICNDVNISGMIGTIVVGDDNDGIFGVSFDEYNGCFHNLYTGGVANCEPGHGLWVADYKLSKETSWDLPESHDDLRELM